MLGPFDYAIWILGFLVEIGVVVCVVYRKDLLRYLPLTIYMLCAAFVNCGQYLCVSNASAFPLSSTSTVTTTRKA